MVTLALRRHLDDIPELVQKDSETQPRFLTVINEAPKESGASNLGAIISRGIMLANAESNDAALRYFDEALAINSDDFLIQFNRAVVLHRLENYKDSLLQIEETLQKIPPSYKAVITELLLLRGYCLHRTKRYKELMRLCNQIIGRRPFEARAYYLLGCALYYGNNENTRYAVESITNAVILGLQDPLVLALRGLVLMADGQLVLSINYYFSILDLIPNEARQLICSHILLAIGLLESHCISEDQVRFILQSYKSMASYVGDSKFLAYNVSSSIERIEREGINFLNNIKMPVQERGDVIRDKFLKGFVNRALKDAPHLEAALLEANIRAAFGATDAGTPLSPRGIPTAKSKVNSPVSGLQSHAKPKGSPVPVTPSQRHVADLSAEELVARRERKRLDKASERARKRMQSTGPNT